jgi:hypothetical protein
VLFLICYKPMFQMFYLDIVYVAMTINACFKRTFQMFSDLRCKCFI